MMKYRTIAILLGMLAFIGCEHQQTDVKPGGISADGKRDGVYVEITLSNDAPSAGEPITLTVQARTETGVSLQTPLIPLDEGDALGAFHVLNIQPTLRRPAPEGGHLWTQHLIIDSLEPGAHAIPPLNFPFSSPTSDSMEQRLEIASIPVSVTSSQPEGMTTPMDIQGWIDLPGPPLWPWLVAGGAAAITIVSGFIFFLDFLLARLSFSCRSLAIVAQYAAPFSCAMSSATHIPGNTSVSPSLPLIAMWYAPPP